MTEISTSFPRRLQSASLRVDKYPEKYYKIIPTELEVCISSECNMACRYCYNRMGPRQSQRTLSWGELKDGLDDWLALTAPERTAGLGTELSFVRKVDFAGREPLLHYGLLRRAVGHLRRRAGKSVEIGFFTNGTLLSRGIASRMLGLGVKISVSLDGPAEVNDLSRVFRDDPRRSVHAAVTKNLLALSPAVRARLTASPTFTSGTISRLPESVRHLLGLGFGQVSIGLEMFERWPRERRAELRAALRGLEKEYEKRLLSGAWPYSATRLFPVYAPDTKCRRLPRVTDEITLGYDGYFYPCTVPALGPAASRKRHRIGRAGLGVDLPRFHSEMVWMDSVIGRHGAGECTQCPVGGIYDCVMRGKSAPAFLGSARKVSEVFKEELGGIFELDGALNAAAMDTGFGDLDHPPRRLSPDGISSIAVELGADGGTGPLSLGSVREGADLALYSPGAEKEIRFQTVSPGEDRGALLTSAAYCLMKAEKLGKKLRLVLRTGKWVPDAKLADFISRHRLFLELVCGGEQAPRRPAGIPGELATAVLRPGGPARDWPQFLDSLARGGFKSFFIEPGGNGAGDITACFEAALALAAEGAVSLRNLEELFRERGEGARCPRARALRLRADGRYSFDSSHGRRLAGSAAAGLDGPYGRCAFSPSAPACSECLASARGTGARLSAGAFAKLGPASRVKCLRDALPGSRSFSGLFSGAGGRT